MVEKQNGRFNVRLCGERESVGQYTGYFQWADRKYFSYHSVSTYSQVFLNNLIQESVRPQEFIQQFSFSRQLAKRVRK
jgi:hypothetical protein